MPEGPEIHRAADTLARAVVGRELTGAYFARPELKPYEEMLKGCRVEAIDARGKALVTRFAGDLCLYTHNQLYGLWKVARSGARPPSKRSLRVALDTNHASILLYSASDVAIWPKDQIEQHPLLRQLGPDVLDPALTPQQVVERLQDRRFRGRQLASLLLDQRFLAGVGNYLRSEILFHAGLNAQQRPQDLTGDQLERLASQAIEVSKRSYRSRGISPASGMRADYLDHSGGGFSFFVFDRAGEACLRCDSIIERAEIGGRRCYRCPQCQPAGGKST